MQWMQPALLACDCIDCAESESDIRTHCVSSCRCMVMSAYDICNHMSLITLNCRLASLTVENTGLNYWDDGDDCDGNVRLPEGFCGAMCNLRTVSISHEGYGNQLVYAGDKQSRDGSSCIGHNAASS